MDLLLSTFGLILGLGLSKALDMVRPTPVKVK